MESRETRFTFPAHPDELDGARRRVLLFLDSSGIHDGYAAEIADSLGEAYAAAARRGFSHDIAVLVRVTGSDVAAVIADSRFGIDLGLVRLDREHGPGRHHGLYVVTSWDGHVDVHNGVGDGAI
jgi:anti-sigma regulatory factor (Ser/Thr protein kinase)